MWRSGRSDWDSPSANHRQTKVYSSGDGNGDEDKFEWPTAQNEDGEEEGGHNRDFHRRPNRHGDDRHGNDRHGDERHGDERRGDERHGDVRHGEDNRWKHDKFSDNDQRRDQSFKRDRGYNNRRDAFNRNSSGRDNNFRQRENYDSGWPKGGSWGNVDREADRERSRSPRRNDGEFNRGYRDRGAARGHDRGAARSHDSDRFTERNRRTEQPNRGYNRRESDVDSRTSGQPNNSGRWPSRDDYATSTADTSDTYKSRNASTTLIIRGVPQTLTAERIREALERLDVAVQTCQLSNTRDPGEMEWRGYIEVGRMSDATYIVEDCKVILA